MFELDFSELLLAVGEAKSYEPLPRHPAVERDVAMILPLTVPVAGLPNSSGKQEANSFAPSSCSMCTRFAGA